jgi:hydroxymethylglutaryl-CoA lyase
VLIEDETLRDGLQMESRVFTLDEKIAVFEILKNAGLRRIQVGSFVHPGIVPQMADTEAFIQATSEADRHLISVLILNARGLERALTSGIRHVDMSVSVSDTHSRKNVRRSASEALAAMTDLIRQARSAGLNVRAGLQCVFGCVYEGAIATDVVLAAAEKMARTGVEEICLADTTGLATPLAVRDVVYGIREALPHLQLSLHLHDTRGLALANMFTGFEAGVRHFDTCVGGLGGCPFVKGAAGNVATEDAVDMFERMGMATGIDMEKLCHAVDYIESRLERQLPGRMTRVLCQQRRRDPCEH